MAINVAASSEYSIPSKRQANWSFKLIVQYSYACFPLAVKSFATNRPVFSTTLYLL